MTSAAPGRGRALELERRPTRRQLLILGALSAFGPLSLDMYLPGLPSLTRGLHASASAGQLTITGCMLGLGLGQLVAGPLSDTHGRRRPLIAGLLAYVVASAACAAAPSISVLVVVRLLQGMAGGVGIVIARAIVRDLSDGTTAARMFSVLMAVTGVAPVCAPLIGGQVLAFTSWRGVFVILAAIGVPLLLAAVLGLPETLAPAQRHGGGLRAVLRTFRGLLGDRSFGPHAASFSLSFAAMFAYIAGSSFVLENIYGISPQLFSVVFAVNSAGLIAVSQLSGRTVGRLGSDVLLRRGLVAVAVASLATVLVTVAHGGLAGCWSASSCCCRPTGSCSPTAPPARWRTRRGRSARRRRCSGWGSSAPGRLWRRWWGWGAVTTRCRWRSLSASPASPRWRSTSCSPRAL